ncbi:MAG: metallophosphoesterase [Anaerolineae bacterium]|nr:MAG: metallophosphoesterase [Anaerolineae bacterium]
MIPETCPPMKLAVLADIHANYRGLLAVAEDIARWQPDLTIVAGDIVNRGPRPLDCWQFVRARQQADNWLVMRGNHEDYVLSHAWEPRRGLEAEFHRVSQWTYERLRPVIHEIAGLPDRLQLRAPDGSEVRVLHASMRHNRDGIYPENSDAEIRERIAPAPQDGLFLTGHTHRPLIRQVDETLVVNVGSAGVPFDRDPRPGYAQLTWGADGWQARIVRVDYDLPAAQRDFFESGFCEQAGPLTRLMLSEMTFAHSQLYGWVIKYRDSILNGTHTMASAMQEHIQTHPHLYQALPQPS